jgi:anaerobic selenocysteine-containing dehydrogenase
VREGLLRSDLFTVVHEQFMTDTARFADLILPATTQLEQTDLIKPYGHQHLQYNRPAIAPVGEAKSNWTVMRLLGKAMGFDEPWLRQSSDEVIEEVLTATAATNPRLSGITLADLQARGTVPYSPDPNNDLPFADGDFPTPSGKLEIYSEQLAAQGHDPLPDYVPSRDRDAELSRLERPLTMLSGAAHHFTSSTFGNQRSLRAKQGPPTLEINPADAVERGIAEGDIVFVENARGSLRLRAHVTTDVRPGVIVSTKGHWGSLSEGGANVNALTSDELADLGGGSTFHSVVVSVRKVEAASDESAPKRTFAVV